MIKLITATLILLHSPDGRMVRINPEQVTSMRAATEEPNKLIHEDAQCVIHFTDGKYIVVIEPCEEIERMLGRE